MPRDAAAMVLLAVLPFAAFAAEAVGARVFFHHDIQYYFLPYHQLVVDVTRAGHLPLWNPHAFAGIPLLGDGQTAIFFPPNWLFWLAPAPHALTLVVLTQFSIAGVAMFAYARQLRLATTAAIVAALAYMFGGFMAARVVHLSILAGAAVLPLVFWAVDRLLVRRDAGAFVLATVTVALQLVSGHPQVPAYTAAAVVIYATVVGVHAWRHDRARPWVPLALVAGVYVAAALLAAVQLLPWFSLYTLSPRAAEASYDFVTRSSLRWVDWLLLLFPYAYGGLGESLLQGLPARLVAVNVWERLVYVGMAPLALALAALASARRQLEAFQRSRYWAIIAVGVVAGLVAAGDGTPFGRLVYAVPVIGRLRGYSRAGALVAFALAVLAAYGVDRLAASKRARNAAAISALAVAALAVVTVVIANTALSGMSPGDPPSGMRMRAVMLARGLEVGQPNAYVPLAFALVTAAVLWWLRSGLTRLKAAVLVTVVAVDVLAVATTFNPTTPPDVFRGLPASVEFLREDPELFRIASLTTETELPVDVARARLAVSWALPYHLDDVNGFNSLQPRRYTDLLFGPDVTDVSYGQLEDVRLLDQGNAVLTLLGVKYLVVPAAADVVPPPQWRAVFADPTVTIYRNQRWRGRAWFVDEVVVRPPADVLQELRRPGFEPWRVAFAQRAIAGTEAPAGAADTSSVHVERPSPNELRVETVTQQRRLLVISEPWFPGWRAELDGEPVPIHRVDYVLRGVVVPAGEHTVRMVYRPREVPIGAAVSAVTLLVLVALAFVDRRRRSARR